MNNRYRGYDLPENITEDNILSYVRVQVVHKSKEVA